MPHDAAWPALPLAEWRETYDTLHLWTQIVGKIRLALAPPVNHWWHSALYLTARGLTTSPLPHGGGAFEIQFDFIDHRLLVNTTSGEQRILELRPQPCADFYTSLMAILRELGIEVMIDPVTVEMPQPIRLDTDREHASYDGDAVYRCFRILTSTSLVMQELRGRFIGKASPIHFFWGSFDLALTFFSGRRAPAREGADDIMAEGYSHEVSSFGWWPGGGGIEEPAFYAYATPAASGYSDALPERWNATLGEYILPYEEVRTNADPQAMLLDFYRRTYEAAATTGKWDREELERR